MSRKEEEEEKEEIWKGSVGRKEGRGGGLSPEPSGSHIPQELNPYLDNDKKS